MIGPHLLVQSSRLIITRTKRAMPKCPPENLGFGKVLTDHMLKIKWSNANGWHAPEITPAAPIPLHPFSHVFHYAQEVRLFFHAHYLSWCTLAQDHRLPPRVSKAAHLVVVISTIHVLSASSPLLPSLSRTMTHTRCVRSVVFHIHTQGMNLTVCMYVSLPNISLCVSFIISCSDSQTNFSATRE